MSDEKIEVPYYQKDGKRFYDVEVVMDILLETLKERACEQAVGVPDALDPRAIVRAAHAELEVARQNGGSDYDLLSANCEVIGRMMADLVLWQTVLVCKSANILLPGSG